MQGGTLIVVEVVTVKHGHLHLAPIGQIGRLVDHKSTILDPGFERVTHIR